MGMPLAKSNALLHKFAKNFAGYGYTQLVTLAVQFLTVPFFLSKWGGERYAEWLVLTGFPTMLGLLDFGVSQASASKAAMQAAQQDIIGVRGSLQTAMAFSLTVVVFVLSIGTAISLSLEWPSILKLPSLSNSQASWVLVFLLFQLSFTLLGGPINAWFVAMDRASTGFFLLANRRLLDVLITVIVLLSGGTATTLAFVLAIGQAAALLMLLIYATRSSPWPVLGLRDASWNEFRHVAKPAAAHAGITIGQVITLQAGIQFLNQLAPASVVILYSMGRTLMRLILQLGVIANNAMRPELSRLLAMGEQARARNFVKNIALGTLSTAALSYIALVCLGPWVIYIWSHGKVIVTRIELAALGAHALVNIAWYVPATYWMAGNRHSRLAIAYMTGALISICFFQLGIQSLTPIITASIALLLPELTSAMFLLIKSNNRISVDNIPGP